MLAHGADVPGPACPGLRLEEVARLGSDREFRYFCADKGEALHQLVTHFGSGEPILKRTGGDAQAPSVVQGNVDHQDFFGLSVPGQAQDLVVLGRLVGVLVVTVNAQPERVVLLPYCGQFGHYHSFRVSG